MINITGSIRLLNFKKLSRLNAINLSSAQKEYEDNTKDKNLVSLKDVKSQLQLLRLPDDYDVEVPKKHVFQEIRKAQCRNPIYTIEQAALYVESDSIRRRFKYPNIASQHTDLVYAARSYENEYTHVHHFPEVTDFLVVGAGLIGSATAYYTKKLISKVGDVLVLDKDPYNPTNNCTAICNGLLSCQSKSQDISRVAAVSKELIRNLQYDVLCTPEDFAQINYRPCTHLILWPENEVDEVLESVSSQMADGCYTEAKLPKELEERFPFLRVTDSDVALGTHGNQDEALIDPIGLRNLYRTLAQGYGVNFIVSEVIDFNTIHLVEMSEVNPLSAGAVVCRLPSTGELRNLGFAKTLLSLGHNTPFLEARSDMESYMRDQIDDLHFLQPRLRLAFLFSSLSTPVIDFPVITDTDGSILVREDYSGNFKYYLPYDQCESFFEEDMTMFMDLDSDDPYLNLYHKNDLFRNYFENVIKPKLVKRIPLMEDATFQVAHSGFESYNTHDGNPVCGPHPFHATVALSAGYGSRMMTYAPAVAAITTELFVVDEEETFDMTSFYWNRVIKGRNLEEFENLIK